ncbi:MAG: DUF389 domain-containing protein [Planctomycetales bacterium]|nr:DUF389 domain-containing protein [Planctomycetales bacterium]
MIAVLLLDDFDEVKLVRWSVWFAKAWKLDLCLLDVLRRTKPCRSESDDLGDAPIDVRNEIHRSVADGELKVRYISMSTNDLVAGIVSEIRELNPELVVVPRNSTTRSASPDFLLQRKLLSGLECSVLLLCPDGNADATKLKKILTAGGEGNHSYNAIAHAKQLAEAADAKLTAVYVESNIGTDSESVGLQILNRTLSRSVGVSRHSVETKVVVDDNILDGLRQCVDDDVDLIFLGMQHHGVVHRFFFRSLSDEVTLARLGPATAVLREELPLVGKLLRLCDRTVRSNVPQIERDERLALVERIQSSSKWNFDFVALISLSTLIAGGGLIQNSAAVVIGAMLVAPLMTPLLGTGLALIQTNRVLFFGSLATVVRGFLLAFALGTVLGLAVPGLTDEMLARGSPGVLDLAVAFVSGVAAAYATGRPNLVSALPGVAIAASLVPPIATSGIATANGDLRLAAGAALLFLTNILAIVLGTAVSFWAVGIRGSHEHGYFERWAISAGGMLLVLAIVVGAYEATAGNSVPPVISALVTRDLADVSAHCDHIGVELVDNQEAVIVHIRSSKPLDDSRVTRIVELVRRELHQPMPIEVHTELRVRFSP